MDVPIQQVLLETISVIERLGIPYAVMGGFAARAWGLPRPTFDADIAVAADAEGLQELFDALEDAGFDVPSEHRTGFLDIDGGFQKAKVNRFLDRHVWHTDLFVALDDFLRSALSRARNTTIARRALRVMRPEDIILLKLIAHRPKDQADIEEILGICTDLDLAYLREWADRLQLGERLSAFLPHQS
ncbi:MAG: hypothetical protein HUU22_09865 [Phycisphaerae bacterium]|nr:hypothetical protein [Phycisphaerae bacterium]NUQ46327.1 hypothetical protein [Phycisphaerae bacterium]